MGDLLGIAASGLRAAQAGIETVADNVAGAGVPGRVRRQTVAQEGVPAGRWPGGVEVAGVRRLADEFRIAESRRAAGDLARSTALRDALEPTGRILTLDDDSVGAGVGAVRAAAIELAASPGSAPLAAQLAGRVADLDARLTRTAAALDRQIADIDAEIAQRRAAADADTQALAGVERALVRAAPGTHAQATLLDRRDALRDRLAEALPDGDAPRGALAGLAAARTTLVGARDAFAALAADIRSAGETAGGDLAARYERLATGVAQTLAAARDRAGADAALKDSADRAREAVGAVDLDEEAAELLRLQQAWQASSKVIATARALFDALLAAT